MCFAKPPLPWIQSPAQSSQVLLWWNHIQWKLYAAWKHDNMNKASQPTMQALWQATKALCCMTAWQYEQSQPTNHAGTMTGKKLGESQTLTMQWTLKRFPAPQMKLRVPFYLFWHSRKNEEAKNKRMQQARTQTWNTQMCVCMHTHTHQQRPQICFLMYSKVQGSFLSNKSSVDWNRVKQHITGAYVIITPTKTEEVENQHTPDKKKLISYHCIIKLWAVFVFHFFLFSLFFFIFSLVNLLQILSIHVCIVLDSD